MILGAWAAVAVAQEPAASGVTPPVRELDHPRYLDAVDRPLTWAEVKQMGRPTGALRQVALRRAGRTAVRTTLLAAAVVEAWGTVELARRDSFWALPLGIQAGFTGLAAVLSITGAPGARVEDRAIVINAVNQAGRSPIPEVQR